ncbi:MAG TPA: CRISPR-associated primase-polymerase type B, partial [Bacteroidales bacterium]|nr:CRISPR-associated primase-polymerase type B [Bacteroidales bacterium]
MLQTGKNIVLKDDPLTKITVEQLYHIIRKPGTEIEAKIRMLKTVRSIDKKKYDLLKRELPYFVCGIFNPPFRKTENFGWIDRFMLDIDNLTEKGLNVNSLKNRLSSDSRIEMIFISPGGDGLKIMFRLSEKCYEHGKFSVFYKVFARSFAESYGVVQVIDPRTSDVTRACFFSYDPEVYYNQSPEPVNMSSFVDFDNPFEVFELQKEVKELEKEFREREQEKKELDETAGPDEEILARIRQTLNPKARIRSRKMIYVPDELHSTVERVKEKMASLSVSTDEVIDIHYGKKFRFSVGYRKAEVNLFYGKRGFSVVISPRAGTDNELNSLCGAILK